MVRYKGRYVLVEFADARDRNGQEMLQTIKSQIAARGGLFLQSCQSVALILLYPERMVLRFALREFEQVRKLILPNLEGLLGERVTLRHISGSIFQMQKYLFSVAKQ